MARMCPPDGPRQCTEESREKDVYNALSQLPPDYVVIHSGFINTVTDGIHDFAEVDFIVFHPDKGTLLIECKRGNLEYDKGLCTEEGERVFLEPYRQVKHAFDLYIEKTKRVMFPSDGTRPYGYCACRFALCLIEITDSALDALPFTLEHERELILSKNDLEGDVKAAIDRLYGLHIERSNGRIVHSMTKDQAESYVNEVLLPTFEVKSSVQTYVDGVQKSIVKLTEAQTRVLDYTRYEDMVAIGGVSGSGKTVIAIEKTKRLSSDVDRVLFLCYNELLLQSLRKEFAEYDNVDVYSLAGYVARFLNRRFLEDEEICGLLYGAIDRRTGEFPYTHVVIDEYQDFGCSDGTRLLTLKLQEIVRERGGSLYVFFDKLQCVHGDSMPDLSDFPCKLSLYVNCRNTRSIAFTSLSGVNEPAPPTLFGHEQGHRPTIAFAESDSEIVRYANDAIERFRNEGIDDKDIVVLTCEGKSRREVFEPRTKTRKGIKSVLWGTSGNIRFETVRRFKGLEADGVVLIDVGVKALESSPNGIRSDVLLYTGASRAKVDLAIVSNMDDSDCEKYMSMLSGEKVHRKDPRKTLAKLLGTRYIRA